MFVYFFEIRKCGNVNGQIFQFYRREKMSVCAYREKLSLKKITDSNLVME